MLSLITDDVATTPLIVVVRVLPDNVCENELMIFATAEDTPLIIDWNVFVVVDTVFEFMIDVVDTNPLIFVVTTFPVDD